MKIGLVPISAKPYHRGHHALVELAASQNDEVILFVSTSTRSRSGEFPIMGDAMRQVWTEELEQILPSNVTPIYGGSPVRKVYEEIENACKQETSDVFTIYSDPVDTQRNYSVENRENYMSPLCDLGQVIFAAEADPSSVTRGVGTPNIQGAHLRRALAERDFQTFAASLPAGVDSKNIYDILSSAAGVTDIPKLAEVFFGGSF